MKVSIRLQILLIALITVLAASRSSYAFDDHAPPSTELAIEEIPEAPVPNRAIESSDDAPAVVLPAAHQKTDREKADEQIKAQEKQRVFGVLPTFNTSYLGSEAVSMTARQKYSLAFHSAIDPVTFATAAIVAGFHETSSDNNGFPWGPKGFGERTGAAYLDSFDGTMIGNAVLPSLLHQGLRYFRMGHGSMMRRLLYAASTTVVCKHDKTGKWEPNYSNLGGNMIAGAISNLYYPSDQGGIELTISNGMIVSAEGAFGAVLNEFWPDLSRKFLHKDPTNGLDDKMKVADEAKKHARRNAQ